jgi:hypothetical protein
MPGMTVAGMTPEYGGPEQALSMLIQGQSNPLVGPWTDVHALSAVVWFILGGEGWCTSNVDKAWHIGERRSLRTAARLHPALVMDTALLSEIDGILARGAAPRIGDKTWDGEGAERLLPVAKARYPHMFTGPERYTDVEAFAAQLLPRLERVAALWTARAARENAAATAFRPTQMLQSRDIDPAVEARATVRERPGSPIEGTNSTFTEFSEIRPGNVVFQPDGKLLARLGDRLVYFVDGEPHKVSVADDFRGDVGASRWVVRGPAGGFAVIGPSRIVLIRGGRMTSMPLPSRSTGGEVGEIQAVIGDGRVFGVVTAETDDGNGGPELWKSADGSSWSGPSVLPLGGDAHAIATGPYGMLVVGSRKGTRGRAMFLGLDEHTTVFTAGVNDRPRLDVAVASAGRECWAAGVGILLRFDRGLATTERAEMNGAPTAMGLDVVGVPWLVTERGVLRRQVEANTGVWRVYHRRADALPALVGIGFTLDGAVVVDERGGIVEIEPHDVAMWRQQGPTE